MVPREQQELMTLCVLSGPPPDYVFMHMTKEPVLIYETYEDS
jgi:hypothetical protein